MFSAPDDNGDIAAHKLAEITVELLDDADGTPLQVRCYTTKVCLRHWASVACINNTLHLYEVF